MFKLVSAITLLVIPASVVAARTSPVVCEKSGVKFEYTSALTPGGTIQIDGHYLPSGEKFSLLVEPSGWVHGTVRDDNVDFFVAKSKRDKILSTDQFSPAVMTASTVQLIGASAH